MPYYQGYPNYNQFYYQQQMQNLQQQNQNQQIQNGGFVSAPSIDYARNYPVAPGNSVTFKDENKPYIYTKTLGYSQLDQPIFEKYRLIKEEDDVVKVQESEEMIESEPTVEYFSKEESDVLKTEMENTKIEIENLKAEIENLKANSDISDIKDEINFLKELIEGDKKESDSK